MYFNLEVFSSMIRLYPKKRAHLNKKSILRTLNKPSFESNQKVAISVERFQKWESSTPEKMQRCYAKQCLKKFKKTTDFINNLISKRLYRMKSCSKFKKDMTMKNEF